MSGPLAAAAPPPLAASLARAWEHALGTGALEPIATRARVVPDGGIDFVLRTVSSLDHKERAAKAPRPRGFDPFLPWDPELFVADLGPTHVALLNKFPVVPRHLLAVTREFEDQERELGASDWRALFRCLAEVPGLGFYNAGTAAGASQRHKHLQLVPLPLSPGLAAPIPVEPVLLEGLPAGGEAHRSPRLPFAHAAARLAPGAPPEVAAPLALERYRELLEVLALRDARAPCGLLPHNVLVTPAWLLLVPRTRESVDGISVNALGFAGSLFARDEADAARLLAHGPLRVLADVARAP